VQINDKTQGMDNTKSEVDQQANKKRMFVILPYQMLKMWDKIVMRPLGPRAEYFAI
jgi:aspartokinase-like uncharacterized kinase